MAPPSGPRDPSPRANDRRNTDRRDTRDTRETRPRRDQSPNRDRGAQRNRRDDRRRSRSRSPARNPRDTPRQRSPRRDVRNAPRNSGPTAAPSRAAPKNAPRKVVETTIAPPEENEDEEAQMKRIMGFADFRTTKNTKVPGNDKLFAVRKDKQTQYRQYMNRVGGFNRPLSPSRM